MRSLRLASLRSLRDIVVQVALLQDFPMILEFRVEEELLVGRDRRIYFVDPYADGGLTTDNPDHAGGVFVNHGIVGGAHYALLVYVKKPVGDDADIIVGNAGDALVVVLCELADLRRLCQLVQVEVGLVLLQQTVALCLDGLVGLQDGKIERCPQVGIVPGFSFFHLEGGACITGKEPGDDGDGDHDEPDTNQKVAPGDVCFQVKTVHDGIFLLQRYKIIHYSLFIIHYFFVPLHSN